MLRADKTSGEAIIMLYPKIPDNVGSEEVARSLYDAKRKGNLVVVALIALTAAMMPRTGNTRAWSCLQKC